MSNRIVDEVAAALGNYAASLLYPHLPDGGSKITERAAALRELAALRARHPELFGGLMRLDPVELFVVYETATKSAPEWAKKLAAENAEALGVARKARNDAMQAKIEARREKERERYRLSEKAARLNGEIGNLKADLDHFEKHGRFRHSSEPVPVFRPFGSGPPEIKPPSPQVVDQHRVRLEVARGELMRVEDDLDTVQRALDGAV